jgi:hypothetical protein
MLLPSSQASDRRQTWILPQAGHLSLLSMSGRASKLKRSVSMPVAMARPVSGQRMSTAATSHLFDAERTTQASNSKITLYRLAARINFFYEY